MRSGGWRERGVGGGEIRGEHNVVLADRRRWLVDVAAYIRNAYMNLLNLNMLLLRRAPRRIPESSFTPHFIRVAPAREEDRGHCLELDSSHGNFAQLTECNTTGLPEPEPEHAFQVDLELITSMHSSKFDIYGRIIRNESKEFPSLNAD